VDETAFGSSIVQILFIVNVGLQAILGRGQVGSWLISKSFYTTDEKISRRMASCHEL